MPPHYSNQSVIHSTGILTRDPATISALINIVKNRIHYVHTIKIKYPIKEYFTNSPKSFGSHFYYLLAISKNLHTSLLTHILLPILILFLP